MNILSGALGYVMAWCYRLISNYGIAIILFTFISKIVILPISIWVQKNSIKMVKMQPEINRIKTRFFGDKDSIADEQSKLFKQEKYNPLASLIPLAVQIILLLGLVAVIYHPLDYLLHLPADVIDAFNSLIVTLTGADPESSSIQLAVVENIKNGTYESQFLALQPQFSDIDIAGVLDSIKNLNMGFLGINLSWVPSEVGGIDIIVPFAAGFSAWLLCVAQNASNVLQAEQSKLNKYGMMALSVGLSLYLGWFVPAGVALYWIASNLFAILQLYLLNWAINPKDYVDYEDLENSKNELMALQGIGGSTISILNTFEPIALPSAISTSFFRAATIEVTSSGSDVPIETIVSPISVWLIPRSLAILDAASTVISPPIAIATAPPTMKRILSGTEISLISSSEPPSISTFLPSLLAFKAILIM